MYRTTLVQGLVQVCVVQEVIRMIHDDAVINRIDLSPLVREEDFRICFSNEYIFSCKKMRKVDEGNEKIRVFRIYNIIG